MTMEAIEDLDWPRANQHILAAEFARLRARLGGAEDAQPDARVDALRAAMTPPPAIDQLTELFGLSVFERDVLLLCAGVEMEAGLATLCAEARGGSRRGPVSFALASTWLPEPHWSALTPSRPLRRFRLIEMEPGQGLTSAPLRVDERILHYLAGVNQLDAVLQSVLQSCPAADWIAEDHRRLAESVAQSCSAAPGEAPVAQLCGDDADGQEDVAASAARLMGRRLFSARTEELPAPGPELNLLAMLWEREARLLPAALLLRCPFGDLSPAARHLAERLPGPLVVSCRDPARLDRTSLRFEVDKPGPAEQKRLWRRALGARARRCEAALDALSDQFRLSAKTIANQGALATPIDAGDLWNACRALARPRLEDLAQRIVPAASWKDLALPEPRMRTLHQLADQVRHRMRVHEDWGFAATGRRGLGVTALFAGVSGTGKTLAAEVLARELGLDLYRVDTSAIVSKYIGETPKHLKRVFDAAEEGGVLLLFDEADALFGKRGEVNDSNDRHANIEVGYLLQRLEAYQGLAILTTNLKSSIDRAFLRRLRFVVTFPFPDAAQREAIWSRMFPDKTPTQGLDPKRLAQLSVAGGNIRNIALNAAFLAASAGEGVSMAHLLQAARDETEKIERPLVASEIRGWA